MTERDPVLQPFDALIGTWATEATHRLFDGVVPGSVSFEWLEGGHFLIQRSRNEHELFPDAIAVIGASEAGDGLVAEYFDSRGVRRTYGVSLDGGVLRMWRDAPGFDQRFSATLAADAFEGLWQLAETPGDWKDDLKVTYRRRDADRSREALVRRLAEVSHGTWMRQKHRDQGVPVDEIPTEVTDHDLERAEDAVAELERSGIYPAEPSR